MRWRNLLSGERLDGHIAERASHTTNVSDIGIARRLNRASEASSLAIEERLKHGNRIRHVGELELSVWLVVGDFSSNLADKRAMLGFHACDLRGRHGEGGLIGFREDTGRGQIRRDEGRFG